MDGSADPASTVLAFEESGLSPTTDPTTTAPAGSERYSMLGALISSNSNAIVTPMPEENKAGDLIVSKEHATPALTELP